MADLRTIPPQIVVAVSGATLLATILGGFWSVVNQKIDNLEHHQSDDKIDREKRDDQLYAEIKRIDAELLARRQEFVENRTFTEFKERVNQYMALPYLTRNEFEAWRGEHNKWVDLVTSQLNHVDRGQQK